MQDLAFVMCLAGAFIVFLVGSLIIDFAVWYFNKNKEDKE